MQRMKLDGSITINANKASHPVSLGSSHLGSYDLAGLISQCPYHLPMSDMWLPCAVPLAATVSTWKSWRRRRGVSRRAGKRPFFTDRATTAKRSEPPAEHATEASDCHVDCHVLLKHHKPFLVIVGHPTLG